MTTLNKPVATKKAIVLVSGGLDSATVLAMAIDQGYECHTLSFDYGQRHRAELQAAEKLSAASAAVEHRVISFDLGVIGGSALTDSAIAVPESPTEGIPITYVPARNTIFLSFALGYAEVVEASAIFVGVNAVDYSGYPDCRPDYIAAYQIMADSATKAGVEGHGAKVYAPLIDMSKSDIVREGVRLGVDYAMTVSCYQANAEGKACGKCDSCRLRAEGFKAAGIADPTRYV
ncbi:MAG: 7-cyano-7-deazaguanine synthase QueC [Pseudomonadales bacterium]|nr:7-cyano-7-deazaguanine synthase QueC [Pseudomonadales bacterium]